MRAVAKHCFVQSNKKQKTDSNTGHTILLMTETHVLFGLILASWQSDSVRHSVHSYIFQHTVTSIIHLSPPFYMLLYLFFTEVLVAVSGGDLSVCLILNLLLTIQMVGCVCLFRLLGAGTSCGKEMLSANGSMARR